MRFLRRFFIRLSNFTAGRRADQRLQEEMAEHLALQTEENLRAGMSPAEARRQAALKLGAAQAIRPRPKSLAAPGQFCGSHPLPSPSGPPERWQSGRMRLTRNQVCPQGYRGFESHPLRHFIQALVFVVVRRW